MSEETITLSDEQAIEYGFAPAPAVSEPPAAAPTAPATPAAESPTTVTAPAAEKPAESASPKTESAPPSESGKPLYTPDEVKTLLAEEERTGRVLLDSSRLSPEGRLLQKSFQSGYNPKFEKAKKMLDEANRIKAEIEQAKREAAAKQQFERDVEEHGEDEAKRLKYQRDTEERIARLEWEKEQAKQREMSMMIGNEYRQVAPKFHIPQEQFFEDAVLSYKWAQDLLRVNRGEEPLTMEEANQGYANEVGITNFNNLMRLIKANPENEKALRNQIINEYNQEKAKGPTVSPSSAVNVQPPAAKPAGEVDPNKSTDALVREMLGIPEGEQINLT